MNGVRWVKSKMSHEVFRRFTGLLQDFDGDAFSPVRRGAFLLAAAMFSAFQRDWNDGLSYLVPDSSAYVRASDNFANRLEFGQDYRLWPPLFPIVLAIRLLPANPLSLSLINFVLLFTFLLIGLILFRCAGLRAGWVFLPAFSICDSSPIRWMYRMVDSEALFLPLTLLWMYWWCRFATSRQERFLHLALAAAGACALTRYAGIATFPAMVIFLARKRVGLSPVSWIRVCSVAAAVGFVCLLWAERNYLLSGSFTGPRSVHALRSAGVFFPYLSSTVSNWVVPGLYLHGTNPFAILASAAALGLTMLRPPWQRLVMGDGPTSIPNMKDQVLATSGQFVASYLFVLLASEYVTSIDLPSDRLMSPIFFPVFLAMVCALTDLRESTSKWRLLSGSLIGAWLVYPCFVP